jgi:L-fucose mutarotase
VLIGIPPLLGPDLLYSLRAMGHGDEIAIVDGNYPAEEHARRLVRADGLGVLALIEAIVAVLPLDRAVPNAIFRAAQNNDPAQASDYHRAVDALFARVAPGMSVTPLAGPELYARIRGAHTVVASSEPALFGNVILRKGVVVPASLNGPPQEHR